MKSITRKLKRVWFWLLTVGGVIGIAFVLNRYIHVGGFMSVAYSMAIVSLTAFLEQRQNR